MAESILPLLVELYAEQAEGGASDEKLATTMARIRKYTAPRDGVTYSADLRWTRPA